jgi:DNA invertase Pin-like site-specific DNA recombinase
MSPKDKPSKPVAIYTRVSSQGDRSDEALLSHDLQAAKVRAYLDAKGIPASEEEFRDNDKSGGKMSRPAFDRAVEGVREGRLGGIAVYHLSRFGRTTTGVLELIYEFEQEYQAAVVCLTPNIDTSSPEGRAMLTVFLAFYTLEREQAVVKAQDLAAMKLDSGTSLGGLAPVGYEYEVTGTDSNGKNLHGWLVPAADAPVVREAFELYASGGSLGQVADHLNGAGVLTSRGNPWKITSARDLLRREVYRGVRTRGESVRIEGAHEAIVDDVLWRRVQRRLKPKEGTPVYRTRGDGHPLGHGLVRCGVCGGGMVVGNANGKYRTLRCTTRGGGHPVVMYDRAEEYIVRMAAFGSPITTEGGNSEQVEQAEARLAVAREDLAEVAALLGIEPEQVPAASEQARAVVEAAEALDALVPTGGWAHFTTVEEIEALPIPERRRFLRSVFQSVVLSKEKGPVEERIRLVYADGSVPGILYDGPEGTITNQEALESDDPFFQNAAIANLGG